MPDQGMQRLANGWSAGYDKDAQELTIEFPAGSYTFEGIPPDVAEGLMKASSPGKYYNQRIRGIY